MSDIVLTQSPLSFNLFIYPLSDSSIAQLIYPTSPATHFDKVDEDKLSPNDDIDYVYTVSPTTQTDRWNMADHTTETGTVNYIQVFTRARANICAQSSSGTFQQLIMGTGIGAAQSPNYAPLSTTYKQYSNIWPTKPAGGAWTWTDIDNLQTGITASSPQVTGMGAQFNCRPNTDSTHITSTGNGLFTGYLIDSLHSGYLDGSHCYSNVNEEIPDEDEAFLCRDVGYSEVHRGCRYFSVALPDAPTQAATASIQSITVVTRAKYYPRGSYTAQGVVANWIYCSDTTPADATNAADHWLSTGYNYYADVFLTRPNGSAWTWANIATALFGFKSYAPTDYSEVYVTQFYVIVNYTTLSFNPEIRTTQQYVMVNYTPSPLTATLLAPHEVSLLNTRRNERFIFPDGTYCIGDYGRANKTLSMSGTESSSAIQEMRAVEAMLANPTPVTISGLLDVNQDMQWRLKDFNFKYDIGGDHYVWNADFTSYDYVDGAP